MAQVEEEGRAMLLGRDRIIDRRRENHKTGDGEFATARSPLVLAHDAGDFERGLLPEMVGGGKRLGTEVVDRRYALAYSGAVANQQEMDFPARAPIVEPSFEGHFLAEMAAQVLDIDPRHALKFRRLRADYRALRSCGRMVL